jgi:hypothetical protein
VTFISLAAFGTFLLVGTRDVAESASATDTIVALGSSGTTGKDQVLRFSRKLELLGQIEAFPGAFTQFTQVATDGSGVRWITFDSLNPTTLLRVATDGQLLPSATLGHNPVGVAVHQQGQVYALTRIPLLTPGAMYGVGADGTVLWKSSAPTVPFAFYPRQVATTATGELWVGESAALYGIEWAPLIAQVDPADGDVLRTLELPSLVNPHSGSAGVAHLAGAPDETLWALVSGGGQMLVNTDGERILHAFEIQGGYNTVTWKVGVDGAGRLLVVDFYDFPTTFGDTILRYDPAAPGAPEAAFPMGGLVDGGFVLGPTGEDLYAVAQSLVPPYPERLVRMNLVTGVKSSVPLSPTWFDCHTGHGDSSGFVWANVIDRDGDSDGDGAANGVETAAGSNPFDAQSRPDGPKASISFAHSNNAIILKLVDPDGLLDPVGGLDVAALSVTLGPYGEVFSLLLPFLTFVQVSADLTEATAFFGALPLAADKQWQLEVTVVDRTGAVGWDWQVTPPGQL